MDQMKFAYITFDLDFTDYFSGNLIDEMDIFFPTIKRYIEQNHILKFTWFIRIDRQIECLFGDPMYYYKKHIDKFKWLKDRGHEIAWHHHSYRYTNHTWIQEVDPIAVLSDIHMYGSLARNLGMTVCRMGWGYQTNKSMEKLCELGFLIDSSAIPRPQYKWDKSKKNWEGTTCDWYFPSINDYRISGTLCHSILEVPITTSIIPFEFDTEKEVIRYLNPAFKNIYFNNGFLNVKHLTKIVTITHPYELIKSEKSNNDSILSFDFEIFKKNISLIRDAGYTFNCLNNKFI